MELWVSHLTHSAPQSKTASTGCLATGEVVTQNIDHIPIFPFLLTLKNPAITAAPSASSERLIRAIVYLPMLSALARKGLRWTKLVRRRGSCVELFCSLFSYNHFGSRLHSSPEPHRKGQVAAGCVCSDPELLTSSENRSETTEVPMGKKLNLMVVRNGRPLVGWLNDHTFKIVLILSLLHIGLAYLHTRHSGRADYPKSNESLSEARKMANHADT